MNQASRKGRQPGRRPSRLALRIYLLGLLQIASIIGALVLLPRFVAPPIGAPPPAGAAFPAGGAAVEQLPGPFPPPHRRPPFPLRPALIMLAVVLLCLSVSSVLFARSLARPLAHLSQTARAFGSGVLGARARLERSDEVGEVARAFDEMADQVTHLLAAQRELLANVSHELRTPLARIGVALDLAEEGPPERLDDLLVDIRTELTDLSKLIGDLLTASKLELASGGVGPLAAPLSRSPVDVHALLQRAEGRFRARHAAHPITVEIAGGLDVVDGDEALLQRAIDNLLDNAAKYSDPGQPVELRARRASGALVLEVCDAGIGIAEADLPNLFQPFFRTDRSRARTAGGVGLGLVLVRRIAEAHGGSVSVESRPGAGSAFRIALPQPARP